MIIVNVASKCGLTNSNYTELKELLDLYKEKGLAIAAFPCNQFGGQVSHWSARKHLICLLGISIKKNFSSIRPVIPRGMLSSRYGRVDIF